jgi:hypothetical protein
MRPTALKLTAGLVLFCGLSSAVKAQTADPINVVTTAVPFLRISPDARSGGMGELGVATSADAYSGLWNAGKVAFNKSRGGVGATYTPWMKSIVNDVYLANVTGYFKIDDEGTSAMHGGVRYFSLGDIQFTDGSGVITGDFRPREFGVDLGYSRKLGEKNGVGITLKYINSNLTGGAVTPSGTYKSGSAVAADLAYYHNGVGASGSGWSFGAVMSNLGSKIAYTDNATAKDFIPANLGLGANYTRKFNATNKLSLGLEANKLLVPTPPDITNTTALAEYRSKGVVGSWFSSFGDAPGGFNEELKEFTLSAGAEYTYNEQFSLRAGYFYENKAKGNRRYATAGLGVNYNLFHFNFAYIVPTGAGVSQNPLSNTLRFSVVFDFGNGGEKKKADK